jgi:hypothetical protein
MTLTDDESQESRAFRQALERTMRKMANKLKRDLPDQVGFAIFLFDYGHPVMCRICPQPTGRTWSKLFARG